MVTVVLLGYVKKYKLPVMQMTYNRVSANFGGYNTVLATLTRARTPPFFAPAACAACLAL